MAAAPVDINQRFEATERTALLAGDDSGSRKRADVGAQVHQRDGHVQNTADTLAYNEVNKPDDDIGFIQSAVVGFNLFLLIFIHSINMSGLTMIQGTLALALHTPSPSHSMWFTTSYFIATSSLTPLIGRLVTIFSPRSLIPPTIILFSCGSLIASQADSFTVFVLGRVVMGCGAAGVVALAVIFVLGLTEGKGERGLVIGLVNSAFTMGVSVGAALFGILFPVVGWRPLFWAQAPLFLIAGTALYLNIPRSMSIDPVDENGKPSSLGQKLANIDYLGAMLLILTTTLFLSSLASDIQPVLLISSIIALLAFIFSQVFLHPKPIIPLTVLSSRGVLFSCLAQLGLLSTRWTILFYTPIFMLAVRAAPASVAGSVLIATNICSSLGGLLIGWVHIRRAGSYYLPNLVSVVLFNATIYALGMAASSNIPIAAFVTIVCLNGAASGIMLNYALVHILHLSHRDTQYITTSLLATFRSFGGSFGTSIGGGIFYRLLRSNLISGFLDIGDDHHLAPEKEELVSKLLGTPELVWHGNLTAAERQVAVDGYAGATRGVWQAAAALGLIMFAVQAAAGWTSPEGVVEVVDTEQDTDFDTEGAILDGDGSA